LPSLLYFTVREYPAFLLHKSVNGGLSNEHLLFHNRFKVKELKFASLSFKLLLAKFVRRPYVVSNASAVVDRRLHDSFWLVRLVTVPLIVLSLERLLG
jgi:hypothetical protein